MRVFFFLLLNSLWCFILTNLSYASCIKCEIPEKWFQFDRCSAIFESPLTFQRRRTDSITCGGNKEESKDEVEEEEEAAAAFNNKTLRLRFWVERQIWLIFALHQLLYTIVYNAIYSYWPNTLQTSAHVRLRIGVWCKCVQQQQQQQIVVFWCVIKYGFILQGKNANNLSSCNYAFGLSCARRIYPYIRHRECVCAWESSLITSHGHVCEM